MWFLVKGSFWFAAVLVVLSYFSNQPSGPANSANPIEIGQAFSAASEAYHYVSALCSEKPDVCEKGAETFSALGVRATEGARVAFELLDKQFGTKAADVAVMADPDPTPFPATGSTRPREPGERITTGTVPVPQKRPAH